MTLSNIKKFLESNTDSELNNLKLSISEEVNNYIKQLKKGGASAPIYLEEDIDLTIEHKSLVRICQAYLSKKLTAFEVSYVVDALLMSERTIILNETTKEKLELLTDPEINGELSESEIIDILS
jgi:hypothetical protein